MENPKTIEDMKARLLAATLAEGPLGCTYSGDPPEVQSPDWGWGMLWEYAYYSLHLLDPDGSLTRASLAREAASQFPPEVQARIWDLPRSLQGRLDLDGEGGFLIPIGTTDYLIGWRHLIALEGVKALVPDPHPDLKELIRRGSIEALHYQSKGLEEMRDGKDLRDVKQLRKLLEAAGGESQRTGKPVRLFGKGGFTEKFDTEPDE